MTVKQVLNQIKESTLSEETTNNLIKYLYEDIITEYGGGYDYFVESYSSEIGRFEEQRDVEIIESLYSRRVYSPNSRIQKHELERLEGLLDICKNKLSSEVWKIIEGLMGKNLIRFKDIIIDWKSMGITEEEFNSKGIRTSMEERIHYSDGRVFVYNSIQCSKNQLIEWTLINQNNLSQLEVWKDTGGDNLCYTETILYEWFGLNVQSYSIEFIGTDELEKIDLDLLSNDLKDTKPVLSSKSYKEFNYEDFDKIIIEGLVHQIKDDIEFLYENYEEDEVRRFENNSMLIRQFKELLNVRD